MATHVGSNKRGKHGLLDDRHLLRPLFQVWGFSMDCGCCVFSLYDDYYGEKFDIDESDKRGKF